MFNISKEDFLKVPKYLWIILVFAVLACAAVIFWSILGRETKIKRIEEVKVVKLTNNEIAKKVLDWLNKQKDVREAYRFSVDCKRSDVKNCVAEGSNRSGLGVIWGRFRYLLNHRSDSKEMDILKNDLALYADRSRLVLLQNNHWDCKLMFDLWKSDLLGDNEKKEAEKICFDGEPRLGQTLLDRKNELAGGSLFLTAVEKDIKEKVLAINENKDYEKPIVYQELTDKDNGNVFYKHTYSYFLSDYVTRYKWKQNGDDLYFAYLFFDAMLEQYLKNPSQITTEDRCSLGLGTLDFFNLYEKNHSGQYKKLAQVLFDSVDWNNINVKETRTITSCLKFTDELLEQRKGIKYSEIKDNLLQKLINNNLDYNGFDGNISGSGGFYSDGGNKTQSGVFAKDIRDNGLIVGFL